MPYVTTTDRSVSVAKAVLRGALIPRGYRMPSGCEACKSACKELLTASRRSPDPLHPGLKKIDIPGLVAHGDDDQVVPYKDAALKSAERLWWRPQGPFPVSRHRLCRVMGASGTFCRADGSRRSPMMARSHCLAGAPHA